MILKVDSLSAGSEGGEGGLSCFGGFRVRLAPLVFGERPVDAGQAGVLALALAGRDDQVDLLDGLARRPALSHLGGVHLRRPALAAHPPPV
ncbi:hypothetical protein GCM10011579_016790 [Streptomyces albiflavescens]|uniref:Uncharacterized protein n=1 Tax=Streptomyces albiflavescens TaxID=1623582 RepID=A0A918D1A6_9ACTN|nr:hypothetical protein GCM10011579_016790 [Streptomyces albiflavescens]